MKSAIVPDGYIHYTNEWRMSPGIWSGDLAFFCGVTGAARLGYPVSTDPAKQFRETFRYVGDFLHAAGLSFDDVVEMTTYHVELRKYLEAFMKVKDEFISHRPYPAWSAIGVSELVTDGTLVEIRVIARKPRNDLTAI